LGYKVWQHDKFFRIERPSMTQSLSTCLFLTVYVNLENAKKETNKHFCYTSMYICINCYVQMSWENNCWYCVLRHACNICFKCHFITNCMMCYFVPRPQHSHQKVQLSTRNTTNMTYKVKSLFLVCLLRVYCFLFIINKTNTKKWWTIGIEKLKTVKKQVCARQGGRCSHANMFIIYLSLTYFMQ